MDPVHEKRAAWPLAAAGVLGGMAGGHVLTNLILRRKMRNPAFLGDIFRSGFQHGQQGQQVSDFRAGLARRVIGPEIPEMYNFARYTGALERVRKNLPDVAENLQALPPEKHDAYIRSLGRGYEKRPEVQSLLHAFGKTPGSWYHQAVPSLMERIKTLTPEETAPLQKEVIKASRRPPAPIEAAAVAAQREQQGKPLRLTGRLLSGWRPQFFQRFGLSPRATVPAHPEATGLKALAVRVLPEAILGGAAVSGIVPGSLGHVLPEIAGHFTMNTLRDLASRFPYTKRIFKGMLENARAGKKGPPAWFTDIALSPGVTEFLRTARAYGGVERAAKPLLTPPAPKVPSTARPAIAVRPA